MNCPRCGLNIDEHPANRCLDAWVAIEVMGWHIDRDHWQDAGGKWCAYIAGAGCAESRWQPSSDIVDAWEIMNCMAGNSEFTYALLRQYPEYGIFVHDDWPAVVTALLGDRELPLRVCRAALKVETEHG